MKNVPLFGNPRINILLLIDITLIVYLSIFVSDFSSLDDTGLMEALQNSGLTFSSLSLAAGITYLRPLTMLSYLVDFNLWGANPALFHWTNLLIHLCNASLIYYLCRSYLPESPRREGVSLIAALFFAVTPLNSESVAWVSGRTDLLCALFFLLSVLLLINERIQPFYLFIYMLIAYFCSLLAKESSAALMFIVPLYLLFAGKGRAVKVKAGLCSAVALGSLIYLYIRMGPKAEVDNGITKVLATAAGQSLLSLTYESVAAFGFYMKKLVWPFPLNLAIQSIDEPLYFNVGLVAIVAVLVCFIRFPGIRLPLLMIVLCLIPPLLALNGKIPWTLYAERYLYLSTTGTALLIAVVLSSSGRIPQILPIILVIPLGVSTIHRTGQWADPVTLWRNTVAQSPGFPQAHVVYAYELIQVGRIVEAEKYIKVARSMNFENELLRKCESSILKAQRNSGQGSIR